MGENYCSKCNAKLSTCPRCKGKGTIYVSSLLSGSEKPCPNCNGTGKICPKHGNDHG